MRWVPETFWLWLCGSDIYVSGGLGVRGLYDVLFCVFGVFWVVCNHLYVYLRHSYCIQVCQPSRIFRKRR